MSDNFQNLRVKTEYRSLHDDIIMDFYIPVLSRSILYQRAVGFFSSSALAQSAIGIGELVKNGGKIQLIASPRLSREDIEAINLGYEEKGKRIKDALLKELTVAKDYFEILRLNLLANLIAENILDIKIAITNHNSNHGMYHEKMGIFTDKDGNKIAFSGSMNESEHGLSINYESIDVFRSWNNNDASERVLNKVRSFDALWKNQQENLIIIDFPEIKELIVSKYKNSDMDLNVENQIREHYRIHRPPTPSIPYPVELYEYQTQAIDAWVSQNFHGIFDMATGTGKTITALSAIQKLFEVIPGKHGVIIVCPYQHLVEQWVEEMALFNIFPIVGHSGKAHRGWQNQLRMKITDQNVSLPSAEKIFFICTNASFRLDDTQSILSKFKAPLTLVVDEAHNFGSLSLLNTLVDRYKYRLALSATIERHGDPVGTQALFNFFGEKCIEYSLARAISEGKLTPYLYYPIITTFDEDEWKAYDELTTQIGQCVIMINGVKQLSERGKKLAIKRARVVAAAKNKLMKLEETIKAYQHDTHMLVYCGAASLINEDRAEEQLVDAESLNEEFDLEDFEYGRRQIDAVTDLLGNKMNMRISQFTSREKIEEREILKQKFKEGETLQALVAIKCLDEGVNIPKIKIAFILASTTNPKEYIQRRGRVLRLAEGKDKAIIYDMITLPREIRDTAYMADNQLERERGLVVKELARMQEFSRLAINSMQGENLANNLKEAFHISQNAVDQEQQKNLED